MCTLESGIYAKPYTQIKVTFELCFCGWYLSTELSYDITAVTYCRPEVCAGRELESRLRLAARLTAITASTDSRVRCQEEVVKPLFFYGVYVDFRNSTTDSL